MLGIQIRMAHCSCRWNGLNGALLILSFLPFVKNEPVPSPTSTFPAVSTHLLRSNRLQGEFVTSSQACSEIQRCDKIQIAAAREGFFTSTNHEKMNIFSALEARNCLRHKKIHVAGDSYTRQLYIALLEILQGYPRSHEFTNGHERNSALLTMQKKVARSLEDVDITISFVCHDECYPYRNLTSMDCGKCLSNLSTNVDANVVSFQVHRVQHIIKNNGGDRKATIQSFGHEVLNEIFKRVPHVIWGTGPSYNRQKIPYPYNETMKLDLHNTAYVHMMKMFTASDDLKARKIHLLDFHALSRACTWDNCTSDGGHGSRFFARMKAQYLLNTLCTINENGKVSWIL